MHELAHCVVARRHGGEVHEILLFPLGGVSKLEHLPETARDEFAVAIAGPLTSLGLGRRGTAVSVPRSGVARPDRPRSAASWLVRLGWLNLILGVFNLLPAFPLDGGRVLRALLERRHDLLTATRIATRVGHVLAGVLIVVGVLFDLWLALIGMFVYFGATAEEAGTIVHARLRGHRVRELVIRAPNLTADDGDVRLDRRAARHRAVRTPRARLRLAGRRRRRRAGRDSCCVADVERLLASDAPGAAREAGA